MHVKQAYAKLTIVAFDRFKLQAIAELQLIAAGKIATQDSQDKLLTNRRTKNIAAVDRLTLTAENRSGCEPISRLTMMTPGMDNPVMTYSWTSVSKVSSLESTRLKHKEQGFTGNDGSSAKPHKSQKPRPIAIGS